jgi:hypothetical protein
MHGMEVADLAGRQFPMTGGNFRFPQESSEGSIEGGDEVEEETFHGARS